MTQAMSLKAQQVQPGRRDRATKATRSPSRQTGAPEVTLTRQGILKLQGTAGNEAVRRMLKVSQDSSPPVVRRTLDDKLLARYKKALQSKANLPMPNLISAIKTKLEGDSKTRTVEHVGQVLTALGVDHPANLATLVGGGPAITLPQFQGRFHSDEGGGIDGIAIAKPKLTPDRALEVPVLIRGLNAGNMYVQHDGSLVRYDRQNAGRTTTNLQIQIGGKDLRLGKGKSSVTCVVIDDDIITITNTYPAIAAWVAAQVRAAHTLSFTSENNVYLTLDPA